MFAIRTCRSILKLDSRFSRKQNAMVSGETGLLFQRGGQWDPYLTYCLIQKAFSKATYYQQALEQLHGHPEALEALGTPLNVHCLRLTDKYNFVDIAEAQLKIPVSGPKSEGHLHVISSRDAPFQRWHLQEVFLKLEDGQQIPVFKLSGNTGREVKKE
ncbi:cytochrome c oxidase assembly factor 1 homolog isoform X2 [Leptonychotes weddellii]|uniref:Cytochrome c oxidase assembly factor 1 homolog isoform X2 n=2 Tax=Leptonychotes weddellii TaxID=9713 RepID=A0A7F8QIV3_LEPWE|nr:cytochrome c oxidase assembly factor 1 homolog isoform X2 [Leptonychotes weddellii]XP_030880142.1 cytochrome c oxidase assembly factor 1 homolog isoform X2 [Leptonychotes weddellii]XP_030880143.1 cytochrome c oxidase assembly factor 1 homolog isoform X2 [Leptonychotes weddellii]XP_030880144.1 cytochrome c oxidase assembly factor 1 homolog isoform X2 [Leptonychotes weddellii]XP_030880145.1 cytochrome c oxidase assembly factor 1 homolog isoform X2 [Leptonychotes weddellii]XP_030880146.1 cytoc